jgi:hypothetical protein
MFLLRCTEGHEKNAPTGPQHVHFHNTLIHYDRITPDNKSCCESFKVSSGNDSYPQKLDYTSSKLKVSYGNHINIQALYINRM